MSINKYIPTASVLQGWHVVGPITMFVLLEAWSRSDCLCKNLKQACKAGLDLVRWQVCDKELHDNFNLSSPESHNVHHSKNGVKLLRI